MAKPRVTGRRDNPNSKRKQTTREGRVGRDVVQVQSLQRKVDAAEAYARQMGDLVRLRRIAQHRARLYVLAVEMSELSAELEQVEGRAVRTAKSGFPKVAEAGVLSADRLRGKIQVMESRHRNMLVDIVADLGIRAADGDYPIDMLHAAGKLDDVGRGDKLGNYRREIGSYFAALHWRIYGRTPQAQSNGYVAPLNPEEIQKLLERAKSLDVAEPMTPAQRDWLDAAQYGAMRRALSDHGRGTEALVIAVCCHMERPRPAEMDLLRAGLSCLLKAEKPHRDDVPDILVEEMVA